MVEYAAHNGYGTGSIPVNLSLLFIKYIALFVYYLSFATVPSLRISLL